ncbi:MAG TPA: hypothetical protein VK335_29875 [Bryobacteraceae bacterium]|nr:hypothetical protein [Bryobacteraceae bacterium]
MRNLDVDQKQASRRGVSKFLHCGLLLSCMLSAVSATPLHWQFNGVTFNDGGQAFGGFDFDSSSDSYSNINITTTAGKLLQGGYYSSAAPYPNPTANTSFNGVSTVPVFVGSTLALSLSFASPLTSGGGTLSFGGAASESVCANPTCAMFNPQRTITSGTVSAVASTTPKRWFINGVVLSDGTQVFGSFIYDINSKTYSSISVTTTAGPVVPSTSYFVQAAAGSIASLSLVSSSVIVPSSTTVLSLNFQSGLGNSGGTVLITGAVEGTCTNANCSTSNTLRTAVVTGFVSTTPVPGDNLILPQIADGGGFLTELIITNPTGAPITCRLTFWQDIGTPLLLSLNAAGPLPSYVVMVPGHGTQFLSTPGTGPGVAGWGLAENVAQLGVIATFRRKVNGLESEATVEAIPATAGFAMAFDETPGFDTGFALANVSAYDTVIENLYFYDTTGALIFSDSTRILGPHQHESFLFSDRYGAQIAGKRGTVRVYYGVQGNPANGTVGLTGLGLRVNPGGTFTSLPITTSDSTE